MRLHLTLTKNKSIIPFDHVPILVGTLHKWLGRNSWHNQVSLYSFSWLKGAIIGNNGFYFQRNPEWFVSSFDPNFLKKILEGIQNDPRINYGLEVKTITIQDDPLFNESQSFTLATPVLIKRREGERVRHYLFSDKESDQFLTETLVTKLTKAGLRAEGIEVKFNLDYHSPKTKMVSYNGVGNKGSICPVTIRGTPEQIAFAWNVGIGNSTGIGFGALN